jgi:hypothetical protein
MKHRFELILTLVFVILFAGFCLWLKPDSALTQSEVDRYLAGFEQNWRMPADEKAQFMANMRAWGESDDGKPVYMINLMAYYDKVKQIPGVPPIEGTTAQVNDFYEDGAIPRLLELGAYPLVAGEAHGIQRPDSVELLGRAGIDKLQRILVVRYPNRRAFFELFSDPDYLEVMPFKFASMNTTLVPTDGTVVVPELRFALGSVLLCSFLLIGWVRSARRARPASDASGAADLLTIAR